MKITQKNPLLGAHMSAAGGVKNALIAGESIGCTAIQIFTASNRRWSYNLIKDDDVKDYLDHKKKSPIQVVISHASYLINLGSPKKEVVDKSIKALKAELQRCDQLEIPYVVLHPGSRLDSKEQDALMQIATNLTTIITETTSKCVILLETMAGQGSSVGNTFQQLATILNNTPAKKIGICLDTCHIFAAGYNISDEDHYKQTIKQFDQIIGLEKLKAIHLNDSKKECGSCVDRHEHIGAGKIGLQAFKFIMNDTRFISIPKILETPKESSLKDDIRNLSELKKLIK